MVAGGGAAVARGGALVAGGGPAVAAGGAAVGGGNWGRLGGTLGALFRGRGLPFPAQRAQVLAAVWGGYMGRRHAALALHIEVAAGSHGEKK